MIQSVLFIFLLLLSNVTSAGDSAKHNILVVGDSISAAYGIEPELGWVSLLSGKIAQQKNGYQVINASVSGDMTSNGLNRLPDLLKKHQPTIVIIELGGNDGLRGLPLKLIQSNLQKLVKQSQASGARVLLAGMRIPPNYGARYAEAFHQIYHTVAKQNDIELVPFILDGVGGNGALMQSDGIHPTAEAQAAILGHVWSGLEPMLN